MHSISGKQGKPPSCVTGRMHMLRPSHQDHLQEAALGIAPLPGGRAGSVRNFGRQWIWHFPAFPPPA